jgi:CBS domain-containing protein
MRLMKVHDAMTPSVVVVAPSDTVHEAAGVLAESGISGAPVVEGDELVGMLTESDILRVFSPPPSGRRSLSVLDLLTNRIVPAAGGRGPTVRDAMTTQVSRISPAATVWDAAAEIQRRGVKRLPVVDEDGRLVGIISRADIVRVMGRDDQAIRADVMAAIEVLGREVGGEALQDLDVKVDEGVVTLGGVAAGRWAGRVARELASLTPGVVGVRDEITVPS